MGGGGRKKQRQTREREKGAGGGGGGHCVSTSFRIISSEVKFESSSSLSRVFSGCARISVEIAILTRWRSAAAIRSRVSRAFHRAFHPVYLITRANRRFPAFDSDVCEIDRHGHSRTHRRSMTRTFDRQRARTRGNTGFPTRDTCRPRGNFNSRRHAMSRVKFSIGNARNGSSPRAFEGN